MCHRKLEIIMIRRLLGTAAIVATLAVPALAQAQGVPGGIERGSNMTEEYALPLAWGSALLLMEWTRSRRATSRC